MAHEGTTAYGRTDLTPAPWYTRVEIYRNDDAPGRRKTYVRVRACPHCGQRTLTQPLRAPEVAGYLLCANPDCRRALLADIAYTPDYFLPWDGPQTYVRRHPSAGTSTEHPWFTVNGRIVTGTTLNEITVPSPHAPRGALRRGVRPPR